MTNEQLDKIVLMLKSNDNMVRNLAFNMVQGLESKYYLYLKDKLNGENRQIKKGLRSIFLTSRGKLKRKFK